MNTLNLEIAHKLLWSDSPLIVRKIVEDLQCSPRYVRMVLKKLYDQGFLEKRPAFGRGQPSAYSMKTKVEERRLLPGRSKNTLKILRPFHCKPDLDTLKKSDESEIKDWFLICKQRNLWEKVRKLPNKDERYRWYGTLLFFRFHLRGEESEIIGTYMDENGTLRCTECGDIS